MCTSKTQTVVSAFIFNLVTCNISGLYVRALSTLTLRRPRSSSVLFPRSDNICTDQVGHAVYPRWMRCVRPEPLLSVRAPPPERRGSRRGRLYCSRRAARVGTAPRPEIRPPSRPCLAHRTSCHAPGARTHTHAHSRPFCNDNRRIRNATARADMADKANHRAHGQPRSFTAHARHTRLTASSETARQSYKNNDTSLYRRTLCLGPTLNASGVSTACEENRCH